MILKIFNLNAWLVPFPYATERKSRFKKLILTIKSLQPDIVTLQEFSRKKEMETLNSEFPDYYVYAPNSKVLNRSGLVTLSKKKVVKTKFVSYKKHKNSDFKIKLSQRGVLITEFKDYSVYNTILYPEGWNLKITVSDLNHLKKTIDPRKICFVSADLNMRLNDFNKANKNFFSFVEDINNTFAYVNHYVRKWWDRNVTTDKKLDYILVRNPTNKKILFRSMAIKKPLMSDHYGVYSEIEIK